jgi:Putative restriction endonuclease
MFTTMDDDGNINMVEEPSPEYTYTYADYLKWQFEERLELFKGKIFKMSAPNTKLYEEAGVKEYWIVNPVEENLVVHVLEENQKYKGCKMYAGGDVIQSSSISGLSIDATDIFKK